MHRKAQVIHKVLWAARSAAEHNYGLNPDKLYVRKCSGDVCKAIRVPHTVPRRDLRYQGPPPHGTSDLPRQRSRGHENTPSYSYQRSR